MYYAVENDGTRAQAYKIGQQQGNSMEIALLVIVGVLNALLGVAFGRYVWPTVQMKMFPRGLKGNYSKPDNREGPWPALRSYCGRSRG